MAEAGDGNIKVVVRCRPLNSRGKFGFSGQQPLQAHWTLCYLMDFRACARREATYSHVWQSDFSRSTRSRLTTGHQTCYGEKANGFQFWQELLVSRAERWTWILLPTNTLRWLGKGIIGSWICRVQCMYPSLWVVFHVFCTSVLIKLIDGQTGTITTHLVI